MREAARERRTLDMDEDPAVAVEAPRPLQPALLLSPQLDHDARPPMWF